MKRIVELLEENSASRRLQQCVRRMSRTLEAMGIEVLDFTGRAYDPGMVPEVVEVRYDLDLLDGRSFIDETVAPTVTWRGQVVNPGQVTLRRCPGFTT